MSDSVAEHKSRAPQSLSLAVLTVSDSRTEATDTSGLTIVRLCEEAGHRVVERSLLPDEPGRIQPLLEAWCDRTEVDAVLITGGTGIAPRDQTVETVSKLFTRHLPGYGELFRWLSFQEIGPAAMLSRATAGLIHQTPVFVMPGSTAAVKLAMSRLILPELGHVAGLARGGSKT